ncbi:lysine--tRNA ligase [Candidatus Endowatersipora endosymbiont of Watersipora subatra]|uniref:lysine--tRNA ligase n=1 Tax=Candidatus Endowatersipora endosymbiont of Watersipora subatra TaxID=3077946 RepID=UPI00312C7D50
MKNKDFPPLEISSEMIEAAHLSRAWPFQEARKLVKRYQYDRYPDEVIFETGYGPSGLPHIGTFCEVTRTSMIVNAFRLLTEDKVAVRLICFSDDMDGMRKVPDNIPNKHVIEKHLGKPLTQVPDPFGMGYKSFAHHNNAQLRSFLDHFGFSYEFASATEYYTSGRFDHILKVAAQKYQEIMDVILPTLGAERQETYSPFLPISPKSGQILYVPMKKVDAESGTITFDDEDGEEVTLPITGGHVKMQWKPDFGMRWAALGIDFEMYGKDHEINGKVYDKICCILGGNAPEHFVFELFLDEKGEKISKSKGNGLSIEEWLTYALPESLSLFMYQKPRTAKRLYFDVIPRQVDDYFQHLSVVHGVETIAKLENPTWHIHAGNPPIISMPISFSMLLNLVSASNASEKKTLWRFISKYDASATPQNNPKLDEMVGYAIRYFEDFVKPHQQFRRPTARERVALEDLAERLSIMPPHSKSQDLQTEVYSVGKDHGFQRLREWFEALYQILLGQNQGPRFGSFVAILGPEKTVKMIKEALRI